MNSPHTRTPLPPRQTFFRQLLHVAILLAVAAVVLAADSWLIVLTIISGLCAYGECGTPPLWLMLVLGTALLATIAGVLTLIAKRRTLGLLLLGLTVTLAIIATFLPY